MYNTQYIVKKFNKISDALIGKILYEKELENVNRVEDTYITFSEEIPVASRSIINQLNQIKYNEKKELLYSIIQLDGILIGKYIYSIFYGKPLICGHWYYLLMIDNAELLNEKNKWVMELLSVFSDDGGSIKGEENCVVCGAFLDKTNLVEATLINQWGYSVNKSEISEKEKIIYKHLLPINPYDIITENVKKCNSEEFINILKKRKIEDTDKAMLACQYITVMMSKMDINIPPRHFIELIIQCVKDSKQIATLEEFYDERVEEMKINR